MWLGCRAYGEYADNIAASLAKGMRVIVQVRRTQHSYTDNQGQQRTGSLEPVAGEQQTFGGFDNEQPF